MNWTSVELLSARGMRAPKTHLAAAIAATIFATAVPEYSFGQELEEIIVTATKRAESVQDVPLAITAFSGDFTKDVNLNDVKDLVAFTPGVTGNSQDSFIDAISIRGIRTQDFGIGGDPSAAFFKNDLYEGRNGSAVTSLYDMERSEILRGPQGFLFGRNAIGGAFSVHTKKADINGGNSGYVDLDIGQNGHAAIEGAINLPVNDNFALRAAGYHSEEDGVIKNQFDGGDLISHDKSAIRISGAYESDELRVQGFAEYEEREQSGSMYRAVTEGDAWDAITTNIPGTSVGGGEFDIDTELGEGEDDAEILTLGVRVDYDFDFATLTSNTGYKDHDYFYSEDYDGTALHISHYGQDQEGTYFQQELRLTSNSDGPLSWYAGVSYYKEEIETLFLFSGEEDIFCQYYGNYYYPGNNFSGCAELYAYYGSPFSSAANGLLEESALIEGEYTGWSTYVDLTYEVTEKLEVGVGARYTDDEKTFDINVMTPVSELGDYFAYGFSTDGSIVTSDDWTDSQFRIIARYRPDDSDAMLYASFTEGFKSGGFGSTALNNAANESIGYGSNGPDFEVSQADGFRANTFNPEIVDSYELGYKSSWFEGTSDISLTAFYYEYTDLQVPIFISGSSEVKNIGVAESFGLEASITSALSENYSLYAAFSYLDSEATEIQSACGGSDACEGSSLFWAPEYSGALVLNSHHQIAGGEIRGSLEIFGESERGRGWDGLSETEIDSNFEVALRLGYHSDDSWSAKLYVENVTDEDSWDGENNNGGVLPNHFFGPKRPRTVGVSFNLEWE